MTRNTTSGGSKFETGVGRVLVLIEHGRDRTLLVDWLRETYGGTVVTSSDAIDDGFDLCVVDERSFVRHRDRLADRKCRDAPRFLPYLMLASGEETERVAATWELIDEVAVVPLQKTVLKARIDGLLRRRQLSTELDQQKRHSEQRFRSLFETAPDPVFVVDDAGRIQDVNDAFCRLTSLSRPEALGMGLEDCAVFPSETTDELLASMVDDRAEGQTRTVQYHPVSGGRRYAEVSTATVSTAAADDAALCLLHDVTDRERRERELKEQNKRLDEFASMLAHELRNPLGIAQVYLNMARQGDDDAFGQVDDALVRMEEMIDELLSVARRGRTTGEVKPTDLEEIVQEAWEQVAPSTATLETDELDREVLAKPGPLTEVFKNLFENAIEHVGPEVTVRVGLTDGGIYVEDDGPGIGPDDPGAVFESGYTTAENGTGLGLTIVDRIISAHGWEVDASDPGGARFTIDGVTFVEQSSG
ncbi:two-component system sensor histidine kinase NtrB [Natrononativus amylolyticus]|uniref:two-component system sensor histidine kinase NtrB n=1 Tax=Natrononativus amylolyticus TaxID=2963434 RepID=UPI0020CFC5F3|nr:PAS domain-containing sensor histidine kinase [Natrononativus amylolyticus]